jgi:PKD repeat protein
MKHFYIPMKNHFSKRCDLKTLSRLALLSMSIIISQSSFSQNWAALGTGMNNKVYATAVFQGDLYAGGSFTTAGGASANYLAKWNGTAWSAVGTGTNGEVDALAVYSGELYVGGKFTTAGGSTVDYIARWDGGGWSDVQSGTNGYVNAFALYGGEIIVGGAFTEVDGNPINYIVKWDGNNWTQLDTGMSAPVNALTVFGSNLIAGGSFTTAGSANANHIAKWNGTAWSALGSGINNTVYSLSSFGNDLIAGGLFTTAGSTSVNNIAKWNGSAWSALGSGTTGGSTGIVYSLFANGSVLYAGGDFTSAGGNSANYIAKWNGTSWAAMGTGMGGSTGPYSVNAFTLFNSDLVAGGSFTTAGSNSANYIAKWSTGTSVSYFDAGITAITSPSGSFCPGTSQSVKADLQNFDNPVLDSVTINWSVNNSIQTPYKWKGTLSNGNTANVTLGNYIFLNAGTNKIKVWTSSPNGSTDTVKTNDSSSVSVTVLTPPVANAGSNRSICNSSNTTIGTTPVSGITYSWTSIPAGFTSSSANPVVSPTVSTWYYLTVTNSANCTNTDSAFIKILPIPNAMWTSIANKRIVNFNPSDVTFASYSWDFGDGRTSILPNPTNVYIKDSVFTVVLTVIDSNGCTGQYTRKISISSIVRLNDAGITKITNPKGSICESTEPVQVELQNFGKNTLSSAIIHWSVNGVNQTNFPWTGSLVTSATASVTLGNYNFNSAGNIMIRAWSSGPNGLLDSMPTNDSAMSLIVVSAPPSALTGGNRSICSGNSIKIGAAPVNDNTYSWTSKPAGFTSQIADPTITPMVTTTYYLTEKTSAGCSKTDSATITVFQTPDATFTIQLNDPRQYKFKPKVSTYASYKWEFGNGDTSHQVSPEYTYATDGTYKAVLTVISSNGCSAKHDTMFTILTTSINGKNKSDLNLIVYPNPFNQETTVSFNLMKETYVRIDIENLIGQTIAVLADGNKPTGKYTIAINPENYLIKSGTYILRVITDGAPVTRKIIKID